MKDHCRSLLKAALPLLVLVLSAIPSHATSVVMLTDEELTQNSRIIVSGTVRSVFSAWNDEHNLIYTYVEVRTERFLKGNLNTTRIVLKQLGGEVGASGMRISGQPQFVRGQRVLLFLNAAPDATLNTAHIFMGAFSIVKDAATGADWVTREVDAAEVDTLARPDGQVVANRAPLNDYLRRIEETLQRGAIRIERDRVGQEDQPVVAVPPEWKRKKKEAAGYSAEFVLIANGIRWFEPDSGQPVRFSVNPANSPIAGGATSELNRAMSAWSAQSGANITLQAAGQTSACGMVSDGTNTISFGDCMGQLSPPVGCSGVVAITQTSYNYETRTVGGRAYSRLIEADVVFNKGMNCFLGTSANLAEVACHELGHGLGLGHSTDSSAIMWASAHGGGRDATLGNDDKAGVLSLYPSTGGGGGGTGGGGGSGGGGGTGGGGGGTGGGGGGATPLSIATLSLPTATSGRFYTQTLTAAGGTPPYRWNLISGLPTGLSLSVSGTITGTTNQIGFYTVNVQVVDQVSSVVSKRLTLEVAASTAAIYPAISRVKVKKEKKLVIFGQNFRADSVVILNGIVLTPVWFDKDGDTTSMMVKHLLGPAGTNIVYVQNPDTRSQGFAF